MNERGIIPASAFRFPTQQRDAQIDRAPLLLVHLHPARNLLERAQAGTAYLVAQRGAAMPGAGRVGGDFGREWGRFHHGRIIPALLLAPAGSGGLIGGAMQSAA